MAEHILFLTGKLAEANLRRVLTAIEPLPFTYEVHQLGISVAGLMTAEMIKRRLTDTKQATRIIVPGRCRGDLSLLSQDLGIPIERGTDDLKDLPEFFGKGRVKPDLSQYDVLIFAEIVDASQRSIDAVLKRADYYRQMGANVIDLGCLPDTPFPHLTDCIEALHAQGFKVSVDSMQTEELLRAGKAGADYLLSLKESTLWIADEVAATPVLIPEQPDDMDSLYRAIASMQQRQRAFFVDPILDPIPFGFTDSLVRYHSLRRKLPDVPIMMGIGNITELTDADTAGMNALLMGIINELNINAVLATEVSQHARRAIREADFARRLMYFAKTHQSLPKGVHRGLVSLHEKKPFPDSLEEITQLAQAVRDPSFRIQISEQGIHIYNRDGLHTAQNPFDLFPQLNVTTDGSHAFYLGVETARAQIAWQLGKRYNQDEELQWGVAVEASTTQQYCQPVAAPAPMTESNYKTYRCKMCGFLYAEQKGLPDAGIPAGTLWEDVPTDWFCPLCNASKTDFKAI
ncbi:DUF6513 domain-containing protein [Beggiatoa leptomitoformis]|uniref:Dihydropteroate synthase n=1 Tax=Beggiatoa leptomitoformis TaxID=288004 RepID=A0A2N9YDP8_9GAMM|nr:dihydropteroate synthase [Beggiatoa leptomitoformis]AUI68611.1 dihydropteroate synthase [Beggiatoa leptomitoformis]